MKPSQTFVALLALGLATAGSVYASEGGVSLQSAPSHRSLKKFGAYLGLGEPAPTVIGINIAYNLAEFVRLRAGYGSQTVATGINLSGLNLMEASTSTIGMGARFFVPGWNLTPSAGLHWANVSYSGDGMTSVGGFTQSGSHIYSTIGVDWQAQSGFNAGLGYQFSFKSGGDSGLYLTAGWFFDLMS